MANTEKSNRKYDLEDRTLGYASSVRSFVRLLRPSVANANDVKQVLRSSGSVGANYIEANEALSKKDFIMRIKISRKEAKETSYWLRLIVAENGAQKVEQSRLIQEAIDLMKIFGSILQKAKM